MDNFFLMLGIKESFDINADELEIRYLKMQSAAHPDVGGCPALSSTLNKAYGILSNNLSRAEHLLAIAGIPLPAPDIDFMEYVVSDLDISAVGELMSSEMMSMGICFKNGDNEGASKHLSKIKSLRRLMRSYEVDAD